MPAQNFDENSRILENIKQRTEEYKRLNRDKRNSDIQRCAAAQGLNGVRLTYGIFGVQDSQVGITSEDIMENLKYLDACEKYPIN